MFEYDLAGKKGMGAGRVRRDKLEEEKIPEASGTGREGHYEPERGREEKATHKCVPTFCRHLRCQPQCVCVCLCVHLSVSVCDPSIGTHTQNRLLTHTRCLLFSPLK